MESHEMTEAATSIVGTRGGAKAHTAAIAAAWGASGQPP